MHPPVKREEAGRVFSSAAARSGNGTWGDCQPAKLQRALVERPEAGPISVGGKVELCLTCNSQRYTVFRVRCFGKFICLVVE